MLTVDPMADYPVCACCKAKFWRMDTLEIRWGGNIAWLQLVCGNCAKALVDAFVKQAGERPPDTTAMWQVMSSAVKDAGGPP